MRFIERVVDRVDYALNGGAWALHDGWLKLMADKRVKTALRVWLAIVSVLLVAIAALHLVRDKYEIAHNVSESLPQTFFLIDKTKSVGRGDYVAFVHHRTDMQDPYPEGSVFIKYVAASGGAKITSNSDRMVFVDGQYVGYAKPKSKLGVPLDVISDQTVPEGQLYVMGTHRDSYDSRYARIGLIKPADVVGKAIPLF